MTTRNTKEKACKLATPNQYDALTESIEEHKDFVPPHSITIYCGFEMSLIISYNQPKVSFSALTQTCST